MGFLECHCLLPASKTSSDSKGKPLRLPRPLLTSGLYDTFDLVLALGLTELPPILGLLEICSQGIGNGTCKQGIEEHRVDPHPAGTSCAHTHAPLPIRLDLTHTSSKIKVLRISRWRQYETRWGVLRAWSLWDCTGCTHETSPAVCTRCRAWGLTPETTSEGSCEAEQKVEQRFSHCLRSQCS